MRVFGRGSPRLGSWDGARWVRARAILLGIVLAAGLLGVLARAIHLQVLERDWLVGMAQERYLREAELAPRRGEILDRHGGRLASSVEVDSIFVDPFLLGQSPEEIRDRVVAVAHAAELSPEATQQLLERALTPGNRFAWVRRNASPATVAAVRALDLGRGVSTVQEPRRFYPQKELAAQILGFVGADGRGLEGLERALDDHLRGRGAALQALRDARGRRLLPELGPDEDARTGHTVELTLDRNLQFLAEKALDDAMEQSRAAAGSALVLDPHTGEILALAHAPTFNPNVVPGSELQGAVRARAITDAFEPGSTMKVFLLASALERGVIEPRQSFDCEKGRWRVGRHTIRDHRGHKWLTPGEILQVSSNICVGKIGLEMGGEGVASAYRSFGFGTRTGIELPGEGAGVLAPMRSEISIVTGSFGQGPITATPLQIATAMAAVANGGQLLQPWIVRRVIDAEGQVIRQGGREVVGRPISPATAERVTAWMELVVGDGGTAQRAALPGYRVAGKTGTAQKVDPVRGGYGKGRVASFGGFVPADDPRFVILVVIDEPQTSSYGGVVAAPAFRAIAQGALEAWGIPPSEPVAKKAEEKKTRRSRAKALAQAAEGPITVAEEPAEGAGQVRVPQVEGLFARAAIKALAEASLEVEMEGTGRVVDQHPPAGSVVDQGSRVAVTLQPL